MPSLDLDGIEQHQNEPKMRHKGFLAVPSVGMRLAPEILVLELFREVFHSSDASQQSRTRELRPDLRGDDNVLVFSSPGRRAVVTALRGRRKQTSRSREDAFFAPAYPLLAKEAWLSRKRERIIARLLFEGAFAQHLWSRGSQVGEKVREQQVAAEVVVHALLGTQKPVAGAQPADDILAAALGTPDDSIDAEAAKARVIELTGQPSTVFETSHDELASRIALDFVALCQQEQELPRLIWLRLLMAYLRFSLPMWLLAQMRLSVLVHGWLVAALDGKDCPGESDMLAAIGGRNRNLVRPTLTPTREVFSRIAEYIRCRVELNVLLYCLEKLRPGQLGGREISTGRSGSGYIKLTDLVALARACGAELRATDEYGQVPGTQAFLSRCCERFRAWRDPLNKGQGKNIDEFLRVLYRAERGDEAGGHLLIRQGRGQATGFRVFPGQLLLQTIAFLAAKNKQAYDRAAPGGGKLVLQDIEEHFAQYGVNFSLAADARPLLMEELQALGLLAGSSDAGSSVAVTCPF